jgi:hypothetical protein
MTYLLTLKLALLQVTGTGFEGAGITVEAVAAPQTTGNY